MMRMRRQEGSTLIMLIGVVAALAVMAATLVALLGNVQANTSRDRMRAKAFNVAEAAFDSTLYCLSVNWPKSASVDPFYPGYATWSQAFRNEFSSSEFPNPSSGSFVTVKIYDNSDTNGDKTIGYTNGKGWDASWDANGDNYVYIEAQASVGEKSARIKALVMQSTLSVQVPEGVAVYANQDLRMHGGGTSIGVAVPPPGGVTSVYVGDNLGTSGQQDFTADITPLTQAEWVAKYPDKPWPTLDQFITPDILNSLVDTAKSTGRYFTPALAAAEGYSKIESMVEAKTTDPVTGQPWTGLVVIDGRDEATPLNIVISANGVINGDGMNTNPPPGIIILLNGNLDFHGTPTLYDLVYVKGGYTDIGTATIQGMVFCDGGADIGGSEQVMYNDYVRLNLNKAVTLSVKTVPNTWLELQPRLPWPAK
jgi:hypothetical protein